MTTTNGVQTPAIELENIKKVYNTGRVKFEALKGVNLKVYHGETVAVMGPSGCGKSTLMNIVGCLDVPTGGSYFLDGKEVSKLKDAQLSAVRGQNLGFVFQSYNLLSRISVQSNVELALLYGGGGNVKKRARAVLKIVGLEDKVKSRPLELSGGQQQRVGIARALVKDPTILLADEPTGNLDSQSSKEIIGIFQRLNQEHNLTLIIVTHEPNIAEHMKRVVRLNDGLIIGDDPVDSPRDATEHTEVTI